MSARGPARVPLSRRLPRLQRELVRKVADHHVEVARLDRPFVVRADEGEVFRSEREVEVAALPRLKVNLCEAPDALAWRTHRRYAVADVNDDRLVPRAPARVRH